MVEQTEHDDLAGSASGAARSGAAYAGDAGSIAAARQFATEFVTRVRSGHGITVPRDVLGAVQLVVSELITNACKYAPGPCVLNLLLTGQTLEITVTDSSPELPSAWTADPDRVGRHGLEIVKALCGGFDVHRAPTGKTIRVLLSLES
ncbi:ATP-binding protein [Streptomyces sp. NPDC058685]|uniref:ATP-binding protein n=1 Tax=Streptomyces sp. NPDC058685 TaxID=3346598 RepID=UPI00366015F8